MLPRAILFDLDDTLADRQAALKRYAACLAEDFRAALHETAPGVIHAALLAADDFGSPRQAERLAADGIWATRPSADALVAHWGAYFGTCATPFAGTHDLLDRLAAAGIALGIVTNGMSAMQRAKIAALGLVDLMDVIIVSAEVGLRKPDGRIFALATDALGVDPVHCWFVGDNPREDMAGARDAGLRPFRVRTGAYAGEPGAGTPLAALTDLAVHLEEAGLPLPPD